MGNINMTGEVMEINLLDMMGGAVGERVSYELSKICLLYTSQKA